MRCQLQSEGKVLKKSSQKEERKKELEFPEKISQLKNLQAIDCYYLPTCMFKKKTNKFFLQHKIIKYCADCIYKLDSKIIHCGKEGGALRLS